MQDFVSKIVPNFNYSSFIAETIESVRKQTYPHWELIFIDDCSTDDSLMVIRKFAKRGPRIRLIESEKNGGAAKARNKGIAASNWRWIAFLDADDLRLENKLEKQIAFMNEKNASFSFFRS